jgi:hypothetical protein
LKVVPGALGVGEFDWDKRKVAVKSRIRQTKYACFMTLLPHPEFHHDVGEHPNYEGH